MRVMLRLHDNLLVLLIAALLWLLAPTVLAVDNQPEQIIAGELEIVPLDVLVHVNGAPITRASFDAAYARLATFSAAADANALAMDLLNQMINDALILQFAAENHISVDKQLVDAEIARFTQRLGADRWDDWLAENLYTADDFRVALHNHYVALAVREHVTAYLHGAVLHVRARHILVPTQADALRVLERLQAGESFGALAAAHSLDVTTRDYGGDLGWFIRGELLDSRLGELAFSQALGEVGGPIASRLGYHVLQVTARAVRKIEAGRMPYLMQSVFRLWLEDQLDAAEIRFNLEALESLPGATP